MQKMFFEKTASDYTNRVNRITANEFNAATRNIQEEKQLLVNLSVLHNEERKAALIRFRSLKGVHDVLKNVSVSTGTINPVRYTKSAIEPRRNAKSRFKTKAPSAKISRVPYTSSALFNSSGNFSMDKTNSSIYNSFEQANIINGDTVNYNEIFEFSDTSESDDESENETIHNAIDTYQAVQPIQPVQPVHQIPVYETSDPYKVVNRTHFAVTAKPPLPVQTNRRAGFKMMVEEDPLDIISRANYTKYQNEKRRQKELERTGVVIKDKKLLKLYHDICEQKDKIPKPSQERIDLLKAKDPIFAKRYKEFCAAKHSGRPAQYDFNDQNIHSFMPKSVLERAKKSIISDIKDDKSIIRRINSLNEKLLNDKVKGFVKGLSSS